MPVLGVCLGMQLLFESLRGARRRRGLGLLAGEVRAARRRRAASCRTSAGTRCAGRAASPLTAGLPDPSCLLPRALLRAAARRPGASCSARREYGERFATVVGLAATSSARQFHPEKSSAHGLALLRQLRAAVHAGAPLDPLPGDRHPRGQGRAAGQGRLRREDRLRRPTAGGGARVGRRRARASCTSSTSTARGRARRRTSTTSSRSPPSCASRSSAAAACARSARCATRCAPAPSA